MSGLAEIYDATLTPGKMDLLRAWVTDRPWFDGDASGLEQVTAYRLVDPDGSVGMESFLVRDGRRTFHIPVTYRDEELPGAEGALVGTLDHSVLGQRWVYDAEVDPVYLAEVRRTICRRDSAADHQAMEDGSITLSPVHIRGGGDCRPEQEGVRIVRVVSEENDSDTGEPVAGAPGTLTGTWPDGEGSCTAVLVVLAGDANPA